MVLATRRPKGGKGKAAQISDRLYFADDLQRSGSYTDGDAAYAEGYGYGYGNGDGTSEEDEEGNEEALDSSWYDVRRGGGAAGGAQAKGRRGYRDEELLERALERISNARAKGKPSVNLTHEELAALQQQDSRQRPSSSRDDFQRQSSNSSNDNERSRKRPSGKKDRRSTATPSPQTKPRTGKGSRTDSEAKPASRSHRTDTPPRDAGRAPVSYFNSWLPADRGEQPARRKKPATPPLARSDLYEERVPSGPGVHRAYNPNMSVPRDRDVGHRSDGPYRTGSWPEDGAPYGRQDPYPLPDSLAQYALPPGREDASTGAMPPAVRLSSDGRRIVSGSSDTPRALRRVPVPVGARGLAGEAENVSRRRVSGRGREASSEDESEDDEDDEDAERAVRRERDQGRRVRELRELRHDSLTPPSGGSGTGKGRNRSGSVGWQRRKR